THVTVDTPGLSLARVATDAETPPVKTLDIIRALSDFDMDEIFDAILYFKGSFYNYKLPGKTRWSESYVINIENSLDYSWASSLDVLCRLLLVSANGAHIII
ncbi:hypothetical protein CHS0354_029161, partial [Potamilus streckersoni]